MNVLNHDLHRRSVAVAFTLFLLAAVCSSAPVRAQQSKTVLFVGNSYTAVNDLPQMVADVALSMGDTLHYSSNTPGGCTFQQHCSNQSMALIRQGGWDAVVLQEQSQYPSFPDSQVQDEVFPYAKRLVDSVYAHGWCAEPMFYMTWGRKDGDAYNAQFFPPLATYEGMDDLLCERYMQMGSDNDASVCPVGRVWRWLRTHHPEIELYQSDGSHPSMAGTYAAACAFYTMLFHGDPGMIGFEAGLEHEVTNTIRGAVRTVVFDSLDNWQRRMPGLQLVVADTLQYMECSVDIDFIDCDSVTCDWGDGTSDTLAAAVSHNAHHLYADTGAYTITFTALRHCMNTLEEYTFHATEAPLTSCSQPNSLGIRPYPNPAVDCVNVDGEHNLVLYGIDGRELRRCRADGMRLDGLPSGIYLLAVDGAVYRICKY